MASTFWWNEEIERAEEWFVFFKTTADRVEAITFIADRHSYDEPEIVAVPIVAGVTAYLDWLRDETRPDDGDERGGEDDAADEDPAGGLLGSVPPQVTPKAERSRSP